MKNRFLITECSQVYPNPAPHGTITIPINQAIHDPYMPSYQSNRLLINFHVRPVRGNQAVQSGGMLTGVCAHPMKLTLFGAEIN